MPLTVKNWLSEAKKRLEDCYPTEESGSMIKTLLLERLGWESLDYILGQQLPIPESMLPILESDIGRLLASEPLQYVLGYTWFNEQKFYCTPATLIPRPETEELVLWILEENHNRKNLQILDIGTGTGCIAINLALGIKTSKVFALDISPDALEIARKNATSLKAAVTFQEQDILEATSGNLPRNLDIIVSNPPYVLLSEKTTIRPNVLQYEPHSALFVPDSDPLLYYRAIIKLATGNLKSGALLYFEINENKANAMGSLLAMAGFKDINIRLDIHGKPRMIRGKMP
jgi:release factor glutamine methyltransferase